MEKTGRDKIADLTRNIGSCVSLPPILTNSPSIESFISFNAVFVKLVSAYCLLLSVFGLLLSAYCLLLSVFVLPITLSPSFHLSLPSQGA